MSLLRASWLHMALGFLAMGAWAYLANAAHPPPIPLQAAQAQGMATALTTLLLKRLVEAVSRRTRGTAQLVRPVLAAWAVSFALLLSVHLLAQTPELWATLLVPNLIATLYAALYAALLRRP